ncbi:uncharacterized protein LOC133823777 [Humulus lupulus]|uniref:uncharacterized protein LOC133823777 n=1 Tax=Humulus lupulus TaxID=3486 RepID=UPI002B417ACF|nr:uncharacterized protein LOC133823777 [Humulus lupulus]
MPDDSQNFEDGADYEEGYYEEDKETEGEYQDHKAKDPANPKKEMNPDQEDPDVVHLRPQVLDQEARIAEQKEATHQMQESLLAFQAFIAAQGLAANPLTVPPPGTQPPAPPIRTGAPKKTSPIPPPGPHPRDGLLKLPQEKGKANIADIVGKENPQKKTHPVPKTRANPGHLPRKERMCPVPG